MIFLKNILKKNFPKSIWYFLVNLKAELEVMRYYIKNYQNFKKHSFRAGKLKSLEQYRSFITKTLHTVEKGLSHEDMRLGFGNSVVNQLVDVLKSFEKDKFPLDDSAYVNAINSLKHYLIEHEKKDFKLDSKIISFVNERNPSNIDNNATLMIERDHALSKSTKSYDIFCRSRHSVRDFDESDVHLDKIKEAIYLAQFTPSACNRQGWRTLVISDKLKIKEILKFQNGSKGFAHKVNKLVAVCGDRASFAFPREHNQIFIDGGLYAINLLNSLHFVGLATCPMSAALSLQQIKNARQILKMNHEEELIMYIAVGNYKKSFCVPRSTRYFNPNHIRIIN